MKVHQKRVEDVQLVSVEEKTEVLIEPTNIGIVTI